MSPIRANKPSAPLRTPAMGSSGSAIEPPATPHRQSRTGEIWNKIARPEHTTVPPSPGVPGPSFEVPEPVSPTNGSTRRLKAHTGAGVQKGSAKKTTRPSLKVKADTSGIARARDRRGASFRFLDLPGEIRNEIYRLTHVDHRQALLVHRPRLASLRPRTRVDRGRTLPSDVTGHENDKKLSSGCITLDPEDAKEKNIPRDSNRPFWGLTQVCRQIRHEYRPIFLAHQEIGVDLLDVVNYMRAFYPSAPEEIARLTSTTKRTSDMPFIGNLTIAAGHVLKKEERNPEGIEVLPLLDIWANSIKMEAGFGRYMNGGYTPETDGEAKDLYRLFGRRVLRDRSCSDMNRYWRTILRSRALASIRIHRSPPPRWVTVPDLTLVQFTLPYIFGPVSMTPSRGHTFRMVTRPYIHVIFKKEKAEPWMTEFESMIPAGWLDLRGFGNMDYFVVKVGVEQDTAH